MPKRVALVSQANYDPPSLERSLIRAIELAGFDLSAVRGRRVLLKPNMLGAYPPSMGITTHPSFVAAVGRIFRDAGACVLVGDSPDGVHPIEKTWEVTGMREICRSIGAREARFEAAGGVERDGLWISHAVFDADIVVNLPKFKTHGLTILTLAAKNLFGCVSGMQKTRHHRDCKGRDEFAGLIVRIADIVRPALTIIDGIVAMEGEGPSAGKLTDLGVIVAGQGVHAIDAACCMLVGLSPIELDTLAAAKRLGLWDDGEPIELVGDPLDELRPVRFDLPSTYTRGMRDWWITRFVIDRIWSGMSAQPVIDPKICVSCGLCVDGCPLDAISQEDTDEAPEIDEKKCIQCMCCHEICPNRAIYLRSSLTVRLARWLSNRRSRRAKETQ